MPHQPSRRHLLKQSAVVGTFLIVGPGAATSFAANEKLNIALIGCGGRGGALAGGCGGENFVAACDCNEGLAARARGNRQGTAVYTDYRRMFERQKDLNAVVVATPDHHHFPASMLSIEHGCAVYCEKPLTWSVWEARRLAEFARQKKVATQLGNQGHSGEGCRRLCEMIWDGLLGDVTEVHCHTNWSFSKGVSVGPEAKPPADLDWDVWIGPAPMRPYQEKGLATFSWRGWWDYGTGAIGDQGCHVGDGAFWSLKLAEAATVEVSAESSDDLKWPLFPLSSVVTYKYPSRAGMAPLTLKWFLGGMKPPTPEGMQKDGRRFPAHGSAYYGTKAVAISNQYCEGVRIVPESQHKATTLPAPTLPRVKGNHWDSWIAAAKGGPPSASHFDYGGPLTELALLGNIAIRCGKTFTWDLKRNKAVNCPEADALCRREPRKGWEFGYT